MKTFLISICAIAFVALTGNVIAQGTIKVNPTIAVFTASPDHNTPVVDSYDLEIYAQSNLSTPVRTTNIGKPALNGNDDISVPLVKTGLQNNTNYVFQIVTNGPGGSTRSVTPSNPFVWVDAPRAASNLRAQ